MGPGEFVAFAWIVCIILYGIWMAVLLAVPGVRVFALALIAISAAGTRCGATAGSTGSSSC